MQIQRYRKANTLAEFVQKSADCRFRYQVQRYDKSSASTSFGDLKSKLFLGLLFSSILKMDTSDTEAFNRAVSMMQRMGANNRAVIDVAEEGEATEAFLESTSGKSELFRYNPGKEQRIFSDKHPYYSKRGIRHCAISGDKLAANLDKNEECEVLRNLIKNQTLSQTEKTIQAWAKKEKGIHEAPTTQTGKIIMSRKVAERYLYHAKTKEEKALLAEIVKHNEKLTLLRKDKLGEKKDLSNPDDVKNIERKKQRGVISYTVYSFEDERGKWKIGFEKTNHRGDLHEAPYYIFPMSSKKRRELNNRKSVV